MLLRAVVLIGLAIALLGDAVRAQQPAATPTQVHVGVNIHDVKDPQVRQLGVQARSGAVLTKLWPGSPAEQANLQPGDVIVKCGDRPIANCADLRAVLHASAPGNRHRLEFYRGTDLFSTEITLGRSPSPSGGVVRTNPEVLKPFLFGLRGTSAGRKAAHKLGIESPSGAVIVAVEPNGTAAEAGLQRGDLVTEFGGKKIHNLEDLETAIRRSPAGSHQVFGAVRGQAGLNFRMTIPAAPGAPTQTFAHSHGGYRLQLPVGWSVERSSQLDRPEDHRCDNLLSVEDSYRLYCFQISWDAPQPEQALQQFAAEKLSQWPDSQRVSIAFAGVPAACVAYYGHQPRRAVWRMAFVHAGRRYVINAAGPPLLDLNELPPPVLEVLQTLSFDPAVSAGPPPASSQSPAPDETSKIPAGWVTKTVAGVTLSVPPDWKASDLAAPDEPTWYKGSVLSPDASFGLQRDTPLDELGRGGKLQPEGDSRVGRLTGQRYSVDVERGERPEKGLIVILKPADVAAGTVALVAFAPAAEWESYGKIFQQMLNCVRLAESP